MTLIGFVTPRFLDRAWYENFTVTKNKLKEGDIPVKVVIDSSSFISSKKDNGLRTYQDLVDEIIELKKTIRELKISRQ
jgi:hypothetical protein